MASCLFCDIANKAIPSERVYEDSDTVAFLDIHPRAVGHTVVVSKTHAPTLIDMPDGEIGPLFVGVKRVMELLARALNPDGFTFGVNHGGVSGQTVEHLHVHVLPRFQGDGGGSLHSAVNHPSSDPLAELAGKIRARNSLE